MSRAPAFRMPGAAVSCAALLGAAILSSACEREAEVLAEAGSQQGRPAEAGHVGAAVCAECHAREHAQWAGSHHDLAMQAAAGVVPAGDFDDAEFAHGGALTRFFRRDGGYWVETEGPDGAPGEFEVAYAFGVEPLQQYLVELEGGRLQALGVAWDDRPEEAGGQRWFHLYPDSGLAPGDPLHWTGRLQNWNGMCADCHSTGVAKGYLPEEDAFTTRWESLDVACEACHGPGSEHARDPFEHRLALGSVERAWRRPDAGATAARRPPVSDRREIEVCARCHSRRIQLGDGHVAGAPLLDTYAPEPLREGLYFSDGQMLDEVYVYGSFVQSAMFAAGVTCSDCHEPHSAALRMTGDDLCTQCHAPAVFRTAEHHRHSDGGPGSACVDCHMPSRTYMRIDLRRDHSFRVPRPDLTAALGTPNACNACHEDRGAEWAADVVGRWFPAGRAGREHYAAAIDAARRWAADRSPLLVELASDAAMPAIARATAFELMAEQLDDAMLDAIDAGLDDPDPWVQSAALRALGAAPPDLRVDLGQRFLTHERRWLRTEAARILAPIRDRLGAGRQRDFAAALEEHLDAQVFNSDRAQALANRAETRRALGDTARAETLLQRALEIEPAHVPSYVNLADLYRETGLETEAERVLRAALVHAPDDPAPLAALALSLVRQNRDGEALALLERAALAAPAEPYYRYLWAIALNSAGETQRALEAAAAASERFPGHRDLLTAAATLHRDAGLAEQARVYAEALATRFPADPAGRVLVEELEEAAR